MKSTTVYIVCSLRCFHVIILGLSQPSIYKWHSQQTIFTLCSLQHDIQQIVRSSAVAASCLYRPCVRSLILLFTSGPIAATTAWFPLLYDTVVVGLTLKAFMRPGLHASEIMQVLVEEGLLYYSVIFSVTLALTIMIASADKGVRNLLAQ